MAEGDLTPHEGERIVYALEGRPPILSPLYGSLPPAGLTRFEMLFGASGQHVDGTLIPRDSFSVTMSGPAGEDLGVAVVSRDQTGGLLQLRDTGAPDGFGSTNVIWREPGPWCFFGPDIWRAWDGVTPTVTIPLIFNGAGATQANVTFVYEGVRDVQGVHAAEFVESPAAADPPYRVWLAPQVPCVVRAQGRSYWDAPGNAFTVDIVEHVRGDAPIAESSASRPPIASLALGRVGPHGSPPDGTADGSFRLGDAMNHAESDLGFATYLRTHPNAVLVIAEGSSMERLAQTTDLWSLTLADGNSAYLVVIERTITAGLAQTARYDISQSKEDTPRPPAGYVPGLLEPEILDLHSAVTAAQRLLPGSSVIRTTFITYVVGSGVARYEIAMGDPQQTSQITQSFQFDPISQRLVGFQGTDWNN
ncbi:MAG TPA: hypothetical protein VM370_13210 [Candidatus Thermoplasmatota archaeon]|nr:hypothetical protein [Candidatus Thermoplasmatota archaeon]